MLLVRLLIVVVVMATLNLENLPHDIDVLLASSPVKRISSRRLHELYENASYGWVCQTGLKSSNQFIEIHLIFFHDQGSVEYNDLPKIYIPHPDFESLKMPHVEDKGYLCVWNYRTIVDLHNLDYIIELLENSIELINNLLAGNITSDFEDELESYWSIYSKSNSRDFALVDIENHKSRQISYYKTSKERTLFFDTNVEISNVLNNLNKISRNINEEQIEKRILNQNKAALICFPNALHPEEYPNTVNDLYTLVEKYLLPESEKIFELIAKSVSNLNQTTPQILLSFETSTGKALVGLKFESNIFKRKNYKSGIDGFRDNIPLPILLNRITNYKVYGSLISRIDQSWVLGRDKNQGIKTISDHTIAIVGCGSIGSSVIPLLIKSGIHKLILIDRDILNSENLGRHELGFPYIGQNKANALKSKFSKDFPYVKIDSYSKHYTAQPELDKVLSSSDLIVSCTGDWYTDQKLLNLQQKECIAMVVFAFVEAHAQAGHIIANNNTDSIYNALHYIKGSSIGQLKEPATLWNGNTLEKVPACAGEFQPYGAVDIGFVHSLLTEKILSILTSDKYSSTCSIWLGNTTNLNKLGGRWNKAWFEQMGIDVGAGSKVVNLNYTDSAGVVSNSEN